MTNRVMRFKLFFIGIVVMLLTTGCPDEVIPDTRINVDKNIINIQQQGGVDTITMVDNYELWWISSVYVRRLEFEYVESCQCKMPREVSEERYYFAAKRRGFLLNNVAWHETNDSTRLDGDWFKVYVPDDSPKKLIISCDENPEEYERCLLITLYAPGLDHGYGEIEVLQEKKPSE